VTADRHGGLPSARPSSRHNPTMNQIQPIAAIAKTTMRDQ
jgi:hypothetical protein